MCLFEGDVAVAAAMKDVQSCSFLAAATEAASTAAAAAHPILVAALGHWSMVGAPRLKAGRAGRLLLGGKVPYWTSSAVLCGLLNRCRQLSAT